MRTVMMITGQARGLSPPPRGGRMERHGLSSPIATASQTRTGELSPMAFLVGVSVACATGHPHPMRPAIWIGRCGRGAVGDGRSKSRTHLPPPSSCRRRAFDTGGGEGGASNARVQLGAPSPHFSGQLPKLARRLHDNIYSAGGRRDAAMAYAAFRGRLPATDALLEKRGLVASPRSATG